MLEIVVPEQDLFDDDTQEFLTVKETRLQLEHSLISLSKWESSHVKPFLGKYDKTREEILDYIKDMTLTRNVDDRVYAALTEENFAEINTYISAPMTATTFHETNGPKGRSETITSELIYYWMISQNIPMECQKWHLNRLITLIRVCSIKNTPPKKQNTRSLAAQRRALNEQRRRELGTRG